MVDQKIHLGLLLPNQGCKLSKMKEKTGWDVCRYA
jgi:hypothetical protein